MQTLVTSVGDYVILYSLITLAFSVFLKIIEQFGNAIISHFMY